jgi:phosphodiesterase/alkaline phosphatase D-like protein
MECGGDVTSTSVVLWAQARKIGPVTFTCATNPRTTFASSKATNVTDSSLPVKVELTGLDPGTSYHYRVTDAEGSAWRGAAQRQRRRLSRAEVRGFGRLAGELAPYASVANVPSRDLDFFVALGDTIYADVPSPQVPLGQATTAAEFRQAQRSLFGAIWIECPGGPARFHGGVRGDRRP